MKILHVCLANFYIDNYGYQENLLPKFHKLMGHDVKILASTETFIENQKLGYTDPSTYLNEDGIEVTRIPYKKIFIHFLTKKLRFYKGISPYLNSFKPDLIFLHDIQFCSINEFAKYAKNNKVQIYADNHNDYINSCKNFLSKHVLHGMIYRKCARRIMPFVKTFYGVLPARCTFLNEVYKIPKEKIKLLVMGVDDSLFDYKDKEMIRQEIRAKHGIPNDAFVIISGGKIDKDKKIVELAKAFLKSHFDNCYLIIFGQIADELINEISFIKNKKNIVYINWIKATEIFKYYFASDLGFFGGTHSVLWEQAVGCGLPCVFKSWKGFDHVNVNENCVFIDDSTVEKIEFFLKKMFKTREYYKLLKNSEKARLSFSYSVISKTAIGGEDETAKHKQTFSQNI